MPQDHHSITDASSRLFDAVEREDIEAVKRELRSGVGVNIKDDEGNTALHHAARTGFKAMVSFLLDNGADMNEKNNAGVTPMMQAALSFYPSVVCFLIDKGAFFDTRNNEGKTMLDLVTGKGGKMEEILRRSIDARRRVLAEIAREHHNTAAARQKILKAGARRFAL